MSEETPKQKLRRLMSRLKKLTPEQFRELDRVIEEMSDEDAETFVQGIDEAERENPGAIDAMVEEVNKNGIPDD